MRFFALRAVYRVASPFGPITLHAECVLPAPSAEAARDRLHDALVATNAEVLAIIPMVSQEAAA